MVSLVPRRRLVPSCSGMESSLAVMATALSDWSFQEAASLAGEAALQAKVSMAQGQVQPELAQAPVVRQSPEVAS
jgi:hypothetical protein